MNILKNFKNSPKSTKKGAKISGALLVILTFSGALISFWNPAIGALISDNAAQICSALGVLITAIMAIFGTKED